jgi:KUP system potassium uptake protein
MIANNKRTLPLALAALGIVYGDIGSSPLYAIRESLSGLAIEQSNIFGVLSLIFWSLIVIVSIKYLIFILRVDNDGEGGILALLALFKKFDLQAYKTFFYISIFGTALLIGDGMLTPAISVISAIEGLQVISPSLSHLTIPITLIILFGLFLNQYHGSNKIGGLFGPILLIWFLVIGTLGAIHIIDNPSILQAINPYYAINFFVENGWKGYFLLGGVFLVLTGGEALYADLGHFGRIPIRLSWFAVVLPCLLLNYFGQGAHLLNNPNAIVNPFYSLSPDWFAYPLLILATLATIIASQAVITATFSLTKQAVLLNLYPKIPIIQTSGDEVGQIYVPHMNIILGIGTLLLVLIFRSSTALTHAYGIAVNLVMLSVTILIIYYCYKHLKWSLVAITIFGGMFFAIDLAFLGANFFKIHSGGWFPVLVALLFSIIMITWHQGIEYLRTFYYKDKGDFKEILDSLKLSKMTCMPDSLTIFVTDPFDTTGGSLLRYFKLNHMIPEHVLILSMITENQPYVEFDKRFELTNIDKNIIKLTLHNGFMQLVDVPDILDMANKAKIFSQELNFYQATYLVEFSNISPTRRRSTLHFYWQEKLFAYLMRNSELDVEFYRLPYGRSIAIGCYIEI